MMNGNENHGVVQQHSIQHTLEHLSGEINTLLNNESLYETRIRELSTNLGAFKTAYSAMEERLRRQEKERNDLMHELNVLKGLEKRVICLLDGDGMIFTQELMSQGQEGGLAAAKKLTERIRQCIFAEGFEQYQLWVYLFYNKRGLLDTFGRAGLTTARAKFDDFMMGFNQAAERFIMVDVGGSKEAADAKLKVHLEDNIRLPHTYKIFFGGCHDNGYVHNLRSVVTSGLGHKLVLMPGYSEVAIDIRALQLPELRVPELFMTTKLVAPSYNVIATGPPPGLVPTTPKLSSAPQPVCPPTSPPAINPMSGEGQGAMARRGSIPSYKSVLQAPHAISARFGSPVAEPSESSESSEASEIPFRFPRLTPPSPPRQRRINSQLLLSKRMFTKRPLVI
ncbi:uncharacterized protein EDB91DRAFT_424045 [Suillus paluster]|uniref:uncharacterized protein n=1 Tax=Suillus paluster TaxID=48578 RepID=UPI001B8602F7|nr:uncharacterized protein EDB91DRAFT_424045 [Suillus paluster]KAG1753898.1 hypothetical protein EDB91DRAFT_424045 [Suillus paluster]